ncbi:MAG: TetR family transcriptional regulator [Acidobacteriota bacterium]
MESKERILDAAERLFAEKGFAASSLRMITAAAGVNLAAVNYHFGSKEGLLQAVFARRLGPLNQSRLEMLDACEAASGHGGPALEKILEAFLAPPLRMFRPAALARLMGRIYLEPGETARRILHEQLGRVARRFTIALKWALPELPAAELFWRMHFTVGVMAHTLAGTLPLEVISGGLCDPSDTEGALERMIAFVAAGLRAPAPAKRNRRAQRKQT